MFKKVLEYAGEYRKTTYASMAVMLIGIVMNAITFHNKHGICRINFTVAVYVSAVFTVADSKSHYRRDRQHNYGR